MAKESGIQSRTVNALNEVRDCIARVLHGTVFAVRGDPDIYGCYKGTCFVIEMKNAVGRLSNIQKYRLTEWRNAGAVTIVSRDKETAVRHVLRKQSNWNPEDDN